MSVKNMEGRIDTVASEYVNDKTPGFSLLILKGDKILLRKGYGMADLKQKIPVEAATNFAIASNTKQFTCASILILANQGLVDLDEPIERFFPDFPDYRRKVTVRQLMTHTSGIRDYFEDGRLDEDPRYKTADTDEMLELIKDFGDLEFEPQSKFAYTNSAYVMLGKIVEQLSSMRFGAFLCKSIFAPLGMNRTIAPDSIAEKADDLAEGYLQVYEGDAFVFERQPYNMALVGYADGNIQSNVDDMLKWHKYLFESDSEAVLPRKLIDSMFEECYLSDGRGTGYGMGFFVGKGQDYNPITSEREIWHTGSTTGYISRCSRFPDYGASIIMLTNFEGLKRDCVFKDIADIALEEIK